MKIITYNIIEIKDIFLYNSNEIILFFIYFLLEIKHHLKKLLSH